MINHLRLKKNRQTRIYTLLMVMMLLFISCRVPGFAAPTATPTDTPTPTATDTPTSTLTPTPIPTSTSTPTITPSPTLKPTPTLTPTPAGFYTNPQLGFSLTYPAGWQVTKETDTQVQISDEITEMGLIGQSNEDSGASLDTFLTMFVKLFRDPSLGLFTSSTLGTKDQITLGDGTKALRQVITGKYTTGADVTMQIVCAKANTRIYTFVIFGFGTSMKDNADLVDGIYKTIQLFQ